MIISLITNKKLAAFVPVLITLALIIGVVYLTQFYWQPHDLKHFLVQFGPASMVIYVAVVVAANVAAPISASPLLILGFSLYHQSTIWLFALGNIIAMAINFWIARRYGRSLIRKLVGEDNLAKIDNLSRNYGLFALFGVRLFLSGISDIASYAFGLSPIQFKPYMIVSIIASLPPYLLLYSFSHQEQNSVEFLLLQLIIAGILSALFLGTRWLFHRFMRLLLHGV